MKCEKIAIKNLENNDIKGNYLFADDKNYYFDNTMRNSIFLKDKEDDFIASFDFYYNYLRELLTVCKGAKNKPSILYVGNDFKSEEFTEIEDIKISFNDKQLFVKMSKTEEFDELFDNIIKSRTNDVLVWYDPLFIFIDDFSKINKSNLVRFATVSRSRQVYFVLLVNNKSEFDELDFEFIDSNCPMKFYYNESGVIKVWNYQSGILNKDKKEFIEI